jgi:hypothetical protein
MYFSSFSLNKGSSKNKWFVSRTHGVPSQTWKMVQIDHTKEMKYRYVVRKNSWRELEKLLHALHLGSIKSVELSNLPHLSHWSPLADSLSHPSTGQEPTTNLSAKNLWHDSQ